jgi:acyl dehydratase
MIENRTFEEITVGESAQISRTLGQREIQLFALASGDVNPAHVDPEFAATDMFHKVIAHGLWGGGLISAVLGTELPGPGTIYLEQSLRFERPVGLGDTITAQVVVTGKDEHHHFVTFACTCTNQAGEEVISASPRSRRHPRRSAAPRRAARHPLCRPRWLSPPDGSGARPSGHAGRRGPPVQRGRDQRGDRGLRGRADHADPRGAHGPHSGRCQRGGGRHWRLPHRRYAPQPCLRQRGGRPDPFGRGAGPDEGLAPYR